MSHLLADFRQTSSQSHCYGKLLSELKGKRSGTTRTLSHIIQTVCMFAYMHTNSVYVCLYMYVCMHIYRFGLSEKNKFL